MSTITIKVLEGKALKSMDPNGLSDPYCLMGAANPVTGNFIDPTKCTRSETIRWSLNPSWKRAAIQLDNDHPHDLRIEVWDKDEDKPDDSLGYVILKREELQPGEIWKELQPQLEGDRVTGKIRIVVSSNIKAGVAPTATASPAVTSAATHTAKPAAIPAATPATTPAVIPASTHAVTPAKIPAKTPTGPKQLLTVNVLSASGLPGVDATLADPYCSVGLVEQKPQSGKEGEVNLAFRTEAQFSTCNPVWGNGYFTFDIYVENFGDEAGLLFQVWDKNVAEKDTFVGYAFVNLKEVLKSLAHITPPIVLPGSLSDPQHKHHATLNVSCAFKKDASQKDNEWELPRQKRRKGKEMLEAARDLARAPLKEVSHSEFISALNGRWTPEKLQSSTVRVFVSSTFTDTKAERNFLISDVYPFTNQMCKALGLEFESVDMRWGVRDSTSESHATSALCMSEIQKCLHMSAGPAFICFLGNKYGYRPFPAIIEQEQLDEMWKWLCAKHGCLEVVMPPKVSEVNDAKLEQLLFIPQCYKLDLNWSPPHYVLQDLNLLDPSLKARWWHTNGPFNVMVKMLREAANALKVSNQQMFTISVTEEEILNGIFHNQAHNQQSLFIRRGITNTHEFPVANKRFFVDMLDATTEDHDAITQLANLKQNLAAVVTTNPATSANDPTEGGNLIHIDVTAELLLQAQSNDNEPYIHALSDDVCAWLWDHIASAYSKRQAPPPLYTEVTQHLRFLHDKMEFYVEIPPAQERIISFLNDNDSSIFVLNAKSGCGKTSLVAWAAHHAIHSLGIQHVIVRFLGTTPHSSDVVSLLKSLCSQLWEVLADIAMVDKHTELQEKLKKLMDSGTHMQLADLLQEILKKLSDKNRQVCVFLDSLDQLLPLNHAYALHWLPLQSLPGIKLLVSVLEQKTPDLLGQLHKLIAPLTKNKPDGREWSYALPTISRDYASRMVDKFISSHTAPSAPSVRRTLTIPQKDFLLAEFDGNPTPLFLRVACDIASAWASYNANYHNQLKIDTSSLPNVPLNTLEPIQHVIAKIYNNLEKKHGENLVRQTLRYLVASKHGLSSSEILDLLSSDELVLTGDNVFKWWDPPIRRLPDLLWKRLREDLGKYIADRGAYGLVLHQLYHRQFWETAEQLFLPTPESRQAVAKHLARFFNGNYSSPSLVPFIVQDGSAQRVESADRLIAPQPLNYGGDKYNKHKLAELPFQQINSGDYGQLHSSLYNFEFLEAKLSAGMMPELLEDYCYAITCSPAANEEHVNALNQFYQFLRRSQHLLRDCPSGVLQLALNEPVSSNVLKAAKSQRARNAVYFNRELYSMPNLPTSEDPCLLTFANHTREANTCVITPDGKRVVSGSTDATLKVWDIESGNELLTLRGHTSFVLVCAITQDGKTVVSASYDKTVKVWDIDSGSELLTFSGHTESANTCAVYGRKVVSGSTDNTIKIWDIDTGNEFMSLSQPDNIYTVAIAPDGRKFVSGSKDSTVKVFDFESGKELLTLRGHAHLVLSVAITPDSKKVISASFDKTLKVWDIESGNELFTFKGHTAEAYICTAMPDSRRVVSGADDRSIKIWDIESGEESAILTGHAATIRGLAVTQDGTRLVSGARDNTLKVWNIKSKNEPMVWKGHHAAVYACAITQDGKKALTGSWDNTVKVWEIATGNELQSLFGHIHTRTYATINGEGDVAYKSFFEARVTETESGPELTLDPLVSQQEYQQTDASYEFTYQLAIINKIQAKNTSQVATKHNNITALTGNNNCFVVGCADGNVFIYNKLQ